MMTLVIYPRMKYISDSDKTKTGLHTEFEFPITTPSSHSYHQQHRGLRFATVRWRMRGIEGPAAVIAVVANIACFQHRHCLGGTKVTMGGGSSGFTDSRRSLTLMYV